MARAQTPPAQQRPQNPSASSQAAPRPQQTSVQQPRATTASSGDATAGWTRKESRSSPGSVYYWNETTGETQSDPPPPWEKKTSRSKPGVFYYWNKVTGQTSAQKPEL